MVWFPQKLGYVSTINGLVDTGVLIMLYEGGVLFTWV